MLDSIKNIFDQNIARSKALITIASGLRSSEEKNDILRAAWMMGVGALDAYFCDAYADLISRAIRAKELQPSINVPEKMMNLKMPVIAILKPINNGWRWRMAAREMMEKENILSLNSIKDQFNMFFRKGHKILSTETVESWILHRESKVRLFGISPTNYRIATVTDKAKIKKSALRKFENRFGVIFQRRHDCIHNCDRPKQAIQAISMDNVYKALNDICFLVARCHEGFVSEFPLFLTAINCNAVIRNRVCA